MVASVDWTNPDWVIALLALIGGIVAFVRWVRDGGARDAKLDAALTQLAALTKKVTPNGHESQELGDIAARTEEKVDRLIVTVATQKGHTDAVEAEVFTRLAKLESRP